MEALPSFKFLKDEGDHEITCSDDSNLKHQMMKVERNYENNYYI